MGFLPFICCGHWAAEDKSARDEEFSEVKNVRRFSLAEIKRATEDFSARNKIGEGGFGPVYLGKLKDGREVAVKVLSPESSQGWREFMAELATLAGIRHENLVQILGFCSEKDHRILVYNYLRNGSLAQTLLGGGHSMLEFDWKTRVRIGVGVARGIAFLHEGVKPRIVHRDIKASNILLDDDLNPKISDFGLAKLLPSNSSHVSTRVAGTIGYLAPEYAIRGQLTRKADVYSFGVLLLEIVGGRCNNNTRLPHGDQFLLSRAWDMYEKGELLGMVDCELEGKVDEKEAIKFLKVALLCTQDNPGLRPAMPIVVKMLMGERCVDDEEITRPGILSEFMDFKKNSTNMHKHSNSSAGTLSSPMSHPSSAMTCSNPSLTFTAIIDRWC
ncbi:protein kinase superfamily protein [Wolffia australiana]